MKKEGKQKVYVNRLPEWFDLEKTVYQPVFLQFLPFVCAFFSRVLDKFIDAVALVLRKTVLAQAQEG